MSNRDEEYGLESTMVADVTAVDNITNANGDTVRTLDVGVINICNSSRIVDGGSENIHSKKFINGKSNIEEVEELNTIFSAETNLNDQVTDMDFRENNDSPIVGGHVTVAVEEIATRDGGNINNDFTRTNEFLEVFNSQNSIEDTQTLIEDPNNADRNFNVNNENSIFIQTGSATVGQEVSKNIVFVSPDESLIPNKNANARIMPQHFSEACQTIGTSSEENQEYLIAVTNTENQTKCMICCKIMGCNYPNNNDTTYICSDECLRSFQEKRSDQAIIHQLGVRNFGANVDLPSYLVGTGKSQVILSNLRCKKCTSAISNLNNSLSWEALDFCNEKCLDEYQKLISLLCSNCQTNIHDENMLGKYRVRFGYNIRQFCTAMCLEEYKKNLKICAYCQDDLSKHRNVFFTSFGDKRTQKDFCSILCMQNHNKINQRIQGLNLTDECCVCHRRAAIQIELKFKNKFNSFCNKTCFVRFHCANNISSEKCDMCSKYYSTSLEEFDYLIRYDGAFKRFCQETCRNNYISSNRKILTCRWCKVKKYNFDMIQKYTQDNTTIIACSLICLNSLRTAVVLNKTHLTVCAFCRKTNKGKFCIVPTDGIARYFCSFYCVCKYLRVSRAQFVKTGSNSDSMSNRKRQALPDVSGALPIITNVRSLAPNENESVNAGELLIPNEVLPDTPFVGKVIVLKYSDLPPHRNVATSTKPVTADTGVDFTPIMTSKETQTDNSDYNINVIPIPVPTYVPSPTPMFNIVHPRPIPFPLLIPIPILIPLTRSTTENVFNKSDKKQAGNTVELSETDLLKMAEKQVQNKKSQNVENHTEEETLKAESKKSVDARTDTMQDISVQRDFEELLLDFEANLTVNAITINSVITTQILESTTIKRVFPMQKLHSKHPVQFKNNEKNPKACLKYIFGVNAWKSWFESKKERSSKSELLQLNAKQLNRSLSMFVEEARTPNGDEFTPDTIFYFCLGIQQYLYENERADNIFYDDCYEDFSDSLDTICKNFPICNESTKYIVTRVEEENLWDSKQLGAHSPYALLNTLMFLITKYFNLTEFQDHMSLSFSNFVKHYESKPNKAETNKNSAAKHEFLRFHPAPSTSDKNNHKTQIYELTENEEDSLRCLVKLYDFYLSKCPKNSETRGNAFYLLPKKSCAPNSSNWYTKTALENDVLSKMFSRIKIVKEINIALLTL